jgi:hypothetical protein
VNTAMERLSKTDVRYRFVIDIGNTMKIWILYLINTVRIKGL